MEKITLKDLLEATGGKLAGSFRDETREITGVESDNRRIAEGNVFFAFPGERADGHDFVEAALQGGASGCVITKELSTYRDDAFYVMVEDAIKALGALASWYRSRFDIPVIAVTGSVGKTTTKDMIASVLSQEYEVLKTEGNYNNEIGLPKTLLRIGKNTQMAVVEMGMNHAGEISYLTNIARPTMAVITNIGDAHIGNLGSKENILKAKCEIFEGLQEGGIAVLNADDEYLLTLKEDTALAANTQIIWIGESAAADLRAKEIDCTLPDRMTFLGTAGKEEGTQAFFEVPIPGRHMIYPALTACAVGRAKGLTYDRIAQGIREYVPTKMRMEIHTYPDNITVMNDTYNANPQSMKAGLSSLAALKDVRKIAVLGDMFELGEREEALHREVGAFAGTLPVDTLITVGNAAKMLGEEAREKGLPEVIICEDKEEAKQALEARLCENTAFLFKASRGMKLEELADFVMDTLENKRSRW
ncbi:MAG: UDP-N-acetylmuramoyl-tripeptide--D-alanyl-D-alanine ligase [Lachnospiraceae bacterium]|nr:UDP-N-acetylmuramoyl-tripeptide--D-alanyl-D-alanine ligase [Lachnospiraceae bacterium]